MSDKIQPILNDLASSINTKEDWIKCVMLCSKIHKPYVANNPKEAEKLYRFIWDAIEESYQKPIDTPESRKQMRLYSCRTWVKMIAEKITMTKIVSMSENDILAFFK